MSEPGGLVRRVDYRRLAARGGEVDARLTVADLPRIQALTAGDEPDTTTVELVLRFHEDTQRWVHVTGRVSARLRLVCQRCLQPYTELVAPEVATVVAAHDTMAAEAPREAEPVLADGDTLDLVWLVGEELLLALPQIARCSRDQCRAHYEHAASEARTGSETRQDNPFAVLSQLKRER